MLAEKLPWQNGEPCHICILYVNGNKLRNIRGALRFLAFIYGYKASLKEGTYIDVLLEYKKSIIQCCGSDMFIPDPICLSRIRLFSIPHPGSEFFPSRIRIKEFQYFNPKKWFVSSRIYDPDCSSRISDPDPDFLPDPGSRGQKSTGSGSATLVSLNVDILKHFSYLTFSLM